jgi:fucose 4-O-acetylase-like acetyltransferase
VSTAGAPAPARVRVPLWDNARFIAIYLVVAGHAVQRMAGELDAALAVYLFIYSFHIPLFVLVSGHFAKARLETKDLKRLISDLLIPYLIFETIWSVVQWIVEGNDTVNFVNASWTLWFLLALILWRLVLPVIAILRFPLLWSTVAAVAAGYTEDLDNTLALSRTVQLLPFFVLGWQLKRQRAGERWQEAPQRTVALVRTGAALLLVAVATIIVVGLPLWREETVKDFFFANEAYQRFGYTEWWAGLVRLGVIALSALLCLAVLALIPRRQTWFTPLGAATLYVYLLHTFLLYPLRETGTLADYATVPGLILALVLAAAITLLLSSPVIGRFFRPLIEPHVDRLFVREDADASPGAPSRRT